jgi:hypothetical protein
MNPTADELMKNTGNFVETGKGNVILQPEDGFPIVGGDWPSKFQDAVKVQCGMCDRDACLSPRGHRLHLERPLERPILCPKCFFVVLELSRKADLLGMN